MSVILPRGARVVVRPAKPEETTASGLVLSRQTGDIPEQGTVIAVGPGEWIENTDARRPLDIVVGDVVLFAKFTGIEIKVAGEPLLVLHERDVVAVLA